ncbi:roadblock/LC7 domain-containing protein [Actinosynnema sp. NPDC047251]|uniref:Roadblock/LC7 family protein n=1 Tax=Saccharothrix espanaensis (strain ATCC 51144 / DSM 44229 / JCM 9112 / NBRC 15066 / NRRL 15764) TaxID=1179773 RepID=K0K605_SACES|nr:roadblock/LC7 domain-containing protein [Saccharothrix espanaensis]CCH31988.1 Roadblock/LC7 family protein [Saccharothrix espanaensis DSM 44229]
MTTDHHASPASDFSWLINDFVARVHGVTHALILSADGLSLVASDSVGQDAAEQLAAISSGMLNLARAAATMFHKGTCEQIVVRLTDGYFLFMDIGVEAGLGVLTAPGCDMKVIGYEMTKFVDNAGHALTPQRRADMRRTVTSRRPGA